MKKWIQKNLYIIIYWFFNNNHYYNSNFKVVIKLIGNR